MKRILLTQGKFALVDDEDYGELIKMGGWRLDSRGYAVKTIGIPASKPLSMHRLVNKTPEGMFTDHINRDRLDNRKSNLRTCTVTENNRNRSMQINNSTGVKGVSYLSTKKKWRAQISIDKKWTVLGQFSKIEEAIRIRKEAERKYYKEFVPLTNQGVHI